MIKKMFGVFGIIFSGCVIHTWMVRRRMMKQMPGCYTLWILGNTKGR